MSGKSTQNASSLQGFPRPGLALLLGFILSAAAVALHQLFLAPSLHSHRMRVGPAVQTLRFQAARAESAKEELVVFLGSSRLQSAAHPATLQAALGDRGLRVLNASQPSFTPWQADHVLRVAEGAPIALVVVDVAPWMCNDNLLHAVTGERAPPREGLQLSLLKRPALDRHDLLGLGWLFQHAVSRQPFGAYLRTWAEQTPGPMLHPPKYHTDEEYIAKMRASERYRGENIGAKHHHDFVFERRELQQIEQTAAWLREQGVSMLVIHLPSRPEYTAMLQDDPRTAAQYAEYLKAVRGLSVPTVVWETTADAGLDDSIFLDYGHVSIEDSKRFSAALLPELVPLLD
jgi:hypothetical protein